MEGVASLGVCIYLACAFVELFAVIIAPRFLFHSAPTKQELRLLSEARQVKLAAREFNNPTHFTKWAKMMRSANNMESEASALAAARDERRKASPYAGVFQRLLRYRTFCFPLLVHIACGALVSHDVMRAWTAAVRIESSWFYPFSSLAAMPTSPTGTVSIAAWATVSLLSSEMLLTWGSDLFRGAGMPPASAQKAE